MGDYIDITKPNIESGNFSQSVHAFIRFYDDQRLLIISSFGDSQQSVRVEIPADAFRQMGLNEKTLYIARDMLWREVEIGFDKELGFQLNMKPYSCFIFKIK